MSATLSVSLDSGRLADAVDVVVEACLPGKTQRSSRMAMFGSRFVIAYDVNDDLPVECWSTGEQLVWDLILSVTGRGTADLASLAFYWRHTPEWTFILALLVRL